MNDEAERQRRFREVDEENTAKRAGILGVPYLDLRGNEDTLPLLPDLMSKSDMYRYKMIPLRKGDYTHPYEYGITLSTPESRLRTLNDQAEKESESVRYHMISDSSFRAIMLRYDPPREVTYHNVEIASEGDSATLRKVSDELEKVRPDDILNYLVLQADKLNASDIHLEHQRYEVRVRFRIDGTLHPIAILSQDKYRILFASIASAANLSTAATEAQSGHIVREIGELKRSFRLLSGDDQIDTSTNDSEEHTLNMRIETVPTVYGQDAVIRLFNFRQEMLNLDVLGLDAHELAELKEIVSHPHGMVMVVGPTGSGKSTTLFSVMNALNDPTRKLISLEDPVE
ncbi:MAG: ATPase, T2SS/T4P/T4SS family, partial [Candidatus Saccharibacteria bacterium]|nr:ATPase, T2SS/T4P/T4SS family [Candidatus Saccharibacteria bacterium]